MIFLSKSLKDTKKIAADFLSGLSGSATQATVIGLYGNLGSGKTAFTQCVAETLSVSETVTSPTFLIFKKYQLPVTRYKFLIHVDAYRLKSAEELRKLRFEELLTDPASLILIEWADLVADILPLDHIKLKFEFIDEKTRKISREISFS